jgi:hypothetical protein
MYRWPRALNQWGQMRIRILRRIGKFDYEEIPSFVLSSIPFFKFGREGNFPWLD